MPANTSGWSRSQPSGSSSIRYGDDLLRSDKSLIEETLNSEHYFTPTTSASSASGGIHRPGSARIYSGARSSLSTPASADSADRLFFATDIGSLHYIGASSHSTIAGGTTPPGVNATALATVTIASGVTTQIIFNDDIFDDGGFFSSATTNRLDIPLTGRFLIYGQTTFPSVHSGTGRRLALTLGGVNNPLIEHSIGTSETTHGLTLTVTYLTNASAGSAFGLSAWQDAGVSLSAISSFLMIQRVV